MGADSIDMVICRIDTGDLVTLVSKPLPAVTF